MTTLLAPHLLRHLPSECSNCYLCTTWSLLQHTDRLTMQADMEERSTHSVFLHGLKTWARTRPEPHRSAIRATINRLEREWPMPTSRHLPR